MKFIKDTHLSNKFAELSLCSHLVDRNIVGLAKGANQLLVFLFVTLLGIQAEQSFAPNSNGITKMSSKSYLSKTLADSCNPRETPPTTRAERTTRFRASLTSLTSTDGASLKRPDINTSHIQLYPTAAILQKSLMRITIEKPGNKQINTRHQKGDCRTRKLSLASRTPLKSSKRRRSNRGVQS